MSPLNIDDLEVENLEEEQLNRFSFTGYITDVFRRISENNTAAAVGYRRLTAAARSNDSSENSKSSPTEKAPELDYLSFMLTLSQRTVAQLPPSKEQTSKNNSTAQTDLSISMDMMWLNAFLGRLLYDVFQDPEKLVKIQEKIQKKLSAIKLPLFLEKLEVSHLELGQTVPIVQRAMRPTLNAQGVWVDLDIVYEGGFKMIVDTKVNLNRLRQMQPESPNSESPKSGSPAKNVSLTQQRLVTFLPYSLYNFVSILLL
ncbi:Tabersonine 6,7-epoxidase isoform 2 [Homalodisca vitripennis]|nr:Tabersonine 6,7-epoxidase isoform 2 [Homalodisca vitripennis]